MPVMPIIGIFSTLAVIAATILFPIILQILIHLDYAFLALIIWLFVIGVGGSDDIALLANYEIHTVFKILILLATLAIWYGIQQIRIFNIYVFRIGACVFSAYVFVNITSSLSNSIDIIWKWTIGIIYFVIIMALRIKNNSLSGREQFIDEAKQQPEFINK